MNGPDVLLAPWQSLALELERHVGRVVLGQSGVTRLITTAVLPVVTYCCRETWVSGKLRYCAPLPT